MNTPEELEKSILSGGTIRSDRSIDKQARICSKTVCQWFNHLGYKWKEVQKGVFFNRYEREDVLEYRKTFLNKMKLLLLYFLESSDNRSMLPKVSPDDCIVGQLD